MGLICSIISFPITQPVAIFLIVLGIILLSPLIFGKLKIPYIVGMIIAGVMIGPHGFNVLARDSSFEIFGQVGILYLMFLASVEIEMFNLKKNLGKGILFGLLTFALPFFVGLFVVKYGFSISWMSAALLASMFSSHTLITYPMINRFGLQNTRTVVIAVCSTIVAVLLSLIVLAEVVSTKSAGKFEWQGIIKLGLYILAYGAVIGWLFPVITKWFFRKNSDIVTQFIFVLAMVFVASLVAQLIGLEAILGAFYAGLVLNRFIPSQSGLMSRISFVGNAVFIPYFLIGVGMLINVRVVVRDPTVIEYAAVMTSVALLCKWLAAFITQKIYGYTRDGRNILFGLTSGKAAATIAAVMVGYQYGLVTEDLMNASVLMILVCCLVASVVTERSAIRRRIRITSEELEEQTKGSVKYGRQLVAVSNPITAEGIMKLAILMRNPRNQNPITTLFVRNNDDNSRRAVGGNALKAATEVCESVDIKVDSIERYDLNIVSGITNVLKEKDCTEIVIGLHRKTNIVDTFYGSLTAQLIRATNKMVIMSRCFMPVNTLRNIYVLVPRKAEYETGFKTWVSRVSRLGYQLATRINFYATPDTIKYLKGVISSNDYELDHKFYEMSTWDDFILMSHNIEEEDLMIVIGARRSSVSFTTELENLPNFLSRYFSRQNLVVVFPDQFGDSEIMPTPIDPLVEPGPGRSAVTIWLNKLGLWLQNRRIRRKMKD